MSKAYATLVEQFFRDLDVGWVFEIEKSEKRLNTYIVDHPHEFPNSCLRLTHDNLNFSIPIDTSDTDVVTAAVVGVSQCGYVALLKTLLPFWKKPKNIAIKEAADAGHQECVRLLLTVCNAKYDNSVALQFACMNDDVEMFNLLLPVSEPKDALRVLMGHMQDTDRFAYMEKNECFQRLQSVVQRKTIGAHVAHAGNPMQRKI